MESIKGAERMDTKSLIKKVTALAVIIVFFTTSILPTISGNVTKIDVKKGTESNHIDENHEDVVVNFYSFGLDEQITSEIQMQPCEVEELFKKISKYSILAAGNSQTLETHQLKNEIIQLANVDDIIPESMSNMLRSDNISPLFNLKSKVFQSPLH